MAWWEGTGDTKMEWYYLVCIEFWKNLSKMGALVKKNFVRTRDPKISAPLRFGIARAFLSTP